jgi:ribosome maturation factor RimP
MNGGSRHPAAREERLAALLDPAVRAAGLEIESVRVSRAGSRSVLRVVVDSDHGVSTDELAEASRVVAKQIDASDAMGSGPFTLEVSSPGVDRPLTEPRHWRRAAGRLVRFGSAGSTLEGRVVTAGDTHAVLEIDGTRREFAYAELGAGQVQVEFGSRPVEDPVEEVEPGGH